MKSFLGEWPGKKRAGEKLGGQSEDNYQYLTASVERKSVSSPIPLKLTRRLSYTFTTYPAHT